MCPNVCKCRGPASYGGRLPLLWLSQAWLCFAIEVIGGQLSEISSLEILCTLNIIFTTFKWDSFFRLQMSIPWLLEQRNILFSVSWHKLLIVVLAPSLFSWILTSNPITLILILSIYLSTIVKGKYKLKNTRSNSLCWELRKRLDSFLSFPRAFTLENL